MPNILLTQKCVRSCSYCFAKKQMADSIPDDILSWDNLIYIADLLVTSGERHISLLGGEPTLHPNFNEFILYLLERNLNITVFTSGIMNNNTLQQTSEIVNNIHPDRISFVCNLNNPEKTPFSETQSVQLFLNLLGNYITPGYNIHQIDFDLHFIFNYINQYGLKRFIRLGLAHPIPNQKNKYIPIEKLQIMVNKLISYFPLFENLRVKPGLDCGFPLCLFSDSDIGFLYKISGGSANFGCGPAIDIGTDMSVWSCFPLSTIQKKSIYDFNSFSDITSYYENFHNMVRSEVSGIYLECDDCKYRANRMCSGGCLAHIYKSFYQEPKIRFKEIYQ